MKKVLLSSVVLLSVVAAANVAAAADGGVYTSQGAITFTPSTGKTDPEDPNKPGEPVGPEIDPEEWPEGPKEPPVGTDGPLSIDFASFFYFGEQEITTQSKVYDTGVQKYVKKVNDKGEWVEDPEAKATEGPNYVQVTDNRGTEAGWTLKVKQDKQFTSKNNHVLSGATVGFKNGHVVTASKSAKPTSTGIFTLDFDGTNEGGSAESIVMEAKAGQGGGTYLNNFGTWNDTEATPGIFEGTAKKSVQLSVPGSTTKYAERYTTDFVWTLSDVVSTTPEV